MTTRTRLARLISPPMAKHDPRWERAACTPLWCYSIAASLPLIGLGIYATVATHSWWLAPVLGLVVGYDLSPVPRDFRAWRDNADYRRAKRDLIDMVWSNWNRDETSFASDVHSFTISKVRRGRITYLQILRASAGDIIATKLTGLPTTADGFDVGRVMRLPVYRFAATLAPTADPDVLDMRGLYVGHPAQGLLAADAPDLATLREQLMSAASYMMLAAD